MSPTRNRGVAYFGARILRHVRADLESLARSGFTYVVHTVSENDLRYYAGAMGEIFAATRDAGMEVHADPWGVGGLFGGEAFSAAAAERPDACQVDAQGRHHAALCPNRPETHDLLTRWLEAVAAAGADAIFIDEPHLKLLSSVCGSPDLSAWTCRCAHCCERFAAETGTPMPTVRDPAVEQFRRRSVVGLARRLARAGRAAGMRVVLCALPPEIGGESCLPLEAAAAIEEVDVLGSDPYWVHAGLEVGPFVGATAARVAELAARAGQTAQIWIQGFRIPAGREAEVRTAVAATRAAGVDDLAVWGFEACAHMSHLRPGDPQRTWAEVLEAFA